MADERLPGIRAGVGDEDSEPEELTAEDLLEELEVKNLSELSENELAVIREVLSGPETLEGISQSLEQDERTQERVQQRARATSKIEQQNLFEAQLDELEGIDDDTGILRNVAAAVQTTNSILQDTNSLLNDVVESNVRGASLTIKDSNQVSFDRANKTRDVTNETDISTSLVLVKAPASNDGDLYVGEEGVGVGGGYRIEAGEREKFQVDILINAFQIVSEEPDDSYTYLAIGREN